jgi:hypothetical protein
MADELPRPPQPGTASMGLGDRGERQHEEVEAPSVNAKSRACGLRTPRVSFSS